MKNTSFEAGPTVVLGRMRWQARETSGRQLVTTRASQLQDLVSGSSPAAASLHLHLSVLVNSSIRGVKLLSVGCVRAAVLCCVLSISITRILIFIQSGTSQIINVKEIFKKKNNVNQTSLSPSLIQNHWLSLQYSGNQSDVTKQIHLTIDYNIQFFFNFLSSLKTSTFEMEKCN